ncbi:MAG: hypothetical protein WBY53_05050 [Acidobacteriaceae bacterium]
MKLQRNRRALAERLLDRSETLRRVYLVLWSIGVIRILDMGKVLIAELSDQEAVGSVFL